MKSTSKRLTSSIVRAMLATAAILPAYSMNITAQETAAPQRQKYKELTFPKTVHDFGTFSEAADRRPAPLYIRTRPTSRYSSTRWQHRVDA